MLEDEKNVRELFDPKILKLKEEISYDEEIPIPDVMMLLFRNTKK